MFQEPFGAPYVQATDTDQKAPTMGGAAKEPTYLELGVAPPTGTKPLPQTEAPSVLYADVDKIVPRSKATPQPQSYDDVAVSASGTTVIGATGGNEVMAKQVNKKKVNHYYYKFNSLFYFRNNQNHPQAKKKLLELLGEELLESQYIQI